MVGMTILSHCHYCHHLPLFVWRGWVFDFIVIGIFASTSNFTNYSSFNGLEGITHSSNLDFLLLWDPTALPYPLSYSEAESIESLYSWQSFFFHEPFLIFLTAFLSFEKRSMNCTKELAWSFLPLLWHFCPTTAFLLKPFLRVRSFLYLWHSLVLWVVCAPPCFWHSVELFLNLTFLGSWEWCPCTYLFWQASQYFPSWPYPWHWNLLLLFQRSQERPIIF